MTEETIINGVDVSGCEYVEKSIPVDCSIANCFCYENKNCYYKQMKRLEFENQELGKIIDCKNGTIASLANIRDALIQQNVKLKETLKSVREYFVVLGNIIPTKILAEGSGVFGAINDAKKEIGEVLKDE